MSNNQLLVTDFDTMQKSASALQKSGYFKDVNSEAQAIVKVMAGAELGLPPFASMSGIHIIQGKPVIGANVMATLVKNDPRYDYRVAKCDNVECVIAWYEHGQKVGESSFTTDEAKHIGLMMKDNWKNYTSDMLFARAISRGARRYAPGIFGGSPVYTPDELNADVDEDGYVTGEIVSEQAPAQAPDPEPQPAQPEPAPVDEPHAMTIEEAEAMWSESMNSPYGPIETAQLVFMLNAMLKKPTSENEQKRTAIQLIIKARQNGRPVQKLQEKLI